MTGILMSDTESKSEIVDVLIAGAGIDGLIAALCLHRAGFSVRVNERLAMLDPIGFGIVLQPLCVKLLYELGLETQLNEIGIDIRKSLYYSHHAQLVYAETRESNTLIDFNKTVSALININLSSNHISSHCVHLDTYKRKYTDQ
ncbi:unnamed protein product [Adineta ricciae]|uniref:FAD-binding domain-containing protein n=1 Tax=Adineta ricciae TaxID=249248 RepID=A0A815MDX9_ADIRI|nr:unnamed protein product [Adineta ricciae]